MKQREACFLIIMTEFNSKTFKCKSGTYEL
jgi:hypothetical protein